MLEHIELGPTPADEPCQQVGTESYNPTLARQETMRYCRQLYRMFPIPKELAHSLCFRPKSFRHDFGSYNEACVQYDPNCEAAVNFALHVEANLPANWDAEAIRELPS